MIKFNGLKQWNDMVVRAYGFSMSYFTCPNYALSLDLHKEEPHPGRLRS